MSSKYLPVILIAIAVILIRILKHSIEFRCLVAGWGSQPSAKERKKRQVSDTNGPPSQTRNILKEVDMQVLDGQICQDALRRNVGNPEFFLDQTSFVCAGGDAGKGLCRVSSLQFYC